jgi:hypothetical protein
MKGKDIAFGGLLGLALVVLCIGVVYYHNSTSGSFDVRAEATGNEMINQTKNAIVFFSQVGAFFKTAIDDFIHFFKGEFGDMQLWKLIGAFFAGLWEGFIKILTQVQKDASSGWDDFWDWVRSIYVPVVHL